MREMYKLKLPLWRSKAGKKIAGKNIKEISYPKLCEGLSEFIGAYLGDGTMTEYFIRISGDFRCDLPYFRYLSDLIFNLFSVKASIVKEKSRNTAYLLISSKRICSFLTKNYGDKIKNNVGIPKKIVSSRKLAMACLRGLVDTDGSVSRRGRKGSQFCVQFTSYNRKLLKQVYSIGKRLGVFTYITGNETGTNKWENVLKYFSLVGSSNLRHIVRFNLKLEQDRVIYQKDVPPYYEKNLYRRVDLPFKMVPWSSG